MIALNKLARQLKSQPVKLQFWPLTGPLRILGFPDVSNRNNEDGSSQRGMTQFLADRVNDRQKTVTERHGSVPGNHVSGRQKTEQHMEKSKDYKNCALHYCGGAVFFHEMFWFMSVSPCIMDGHIQ